MSVDHNQLISTKGLRDVYTLLHLSCSHNHLASVEGLENSALLNTLDLRGNSLTEVRRRRRFRCQRSGFSMGFAWKELRHPFALNMRFQTAPTIRFWIK